MVGEGEIVKKKEARRRRKDLGDPSGNKEIVLWCVQRPSRKSDKKIICRFNKVS